MARSTARAVGQRGERLALAHLTAAGLETIASNYYCRFGEIDLIMQDQDTLVFVEVRCRKPSRFGTAAGSVDTRKQRKIVRAAASFLGGPGDYGDRPVRFDVVALDGQPDGRYTIQWLKDAFRPRGRET